MSERRPRVLLDCDPGHDDAFALLFAARTCDLVGITTVSGNVGLESTTRNGLVLRDLTGLDVPLYRGADRPLVAPPLHAEDIHGDSGLDGPAPRTPRGAAETTPAARAIVTASSKHEDLWLVATGPLTNVALALRLDPGLASRLGGISLMGGSRTSGNTTPAAEFNIFADPEAAAAVFASGARIVMAGLDLTHQFRIGDPEIARFRAMGSDVGTYAADLLSFFASAYERRTGRRGGPMHDPCAVLALTDPELFERQALHVAVELRGEHTRGMTVCDARELHARKEPNVGVLTRIDAARAKERLIEVLAGYGPGR